MVEFDSESQRLEDERIITAAWNWVKQGEKLRWPAQRSLVDAAARMAARVSLRYSTGASAENEQNQGDDRQDDENRPQHDADSTPDQLYSSWIDDQLISVVIDFQTYKIVTPEIQAVLDALPEWVAMVETSEATAGVRTRIPLGSVVRGLFDASRAYLASIEPPKPETVYPERWMVVWPKGVGYANRAEAEDAIKRLGVDPGYDALGILHLHPDGTTTMEYPT